MQMHAFVVWTVVLAAVMAGCDEATDTRRVVPVYDDFTRQLVALYADQDGDGRLDQWSYFAGNRALRGEKDVDGDGRIDRWEYFSAEGALMRTGTSSANDGIEDTWTIPAGANGEGRIDHARARDRRVDRREFYVEGALIRAEEDTNADGRIDRWDRYEGNVLRQAEFDTTLGSDRPNRRVLYDAAGHFLRAEVVR